MIERLLDFIEAQYSITQEQLTQYAQRSLIVVAVLIFVLVSTVIVAFDSVFLRLNSNAVIEVGNVASGSIVAPTDLTYESAILTELARDEARNSVQATYSSPSLTTVRTWDQRAEQTLDFIDDVRASKRYATQDEQLADLAQMEYLFFSDAENAALSLVLDDDVWNTIVAEVDNVIELVYRDRIIDAQNYIETQLTIQISPTFDDRTNQLIFDIVDDFVKANTFENAEATADARELAATAVEPVERNFVRGQIIIGTNERIDDLAYEALEAFNLITPEESSLQELIQALIASTITLVIFGLYIARFSRNLLYNQFKRLTVVSVIFLIVLALARFLGINGNIYLFPAAAMALLFVAIADAHVAVITTLGLAFLIGLIGNNSLEITVLITAGGLMGTLGLRRAERLNQFFVAGILIGIMNTAVVILFNPPGSISSGILLPALAFTLFSGLLLAPATAMASMYAVTMLFNMPTALKLIDLQQPNKPLLQRLLREAPGTYQHSLQVGNLAEQAANAIGADAQLTHVAALYHDIGKMHNPLYFTENQQDIAGNPHDTLNDPYRSADIIINHITEGDEMAKQAGLPQRIRDFIREHHGTTQVFVFYQRALQAVDGDEAAVDISDFTYPGPKPRSKETAILMLADSCEAAVRSIKPESKQAIRELVEKIVDGKRKDGQLDESELTLNDIRAIREAFVDILQGMFHPRIDYRNAVSQKTDKSPKVSKPQTVKIDAVSAGNGTSASILKKDDSKPKPKTATQTGKILEDKQETTVPPKPKQTATNNKVAIADEEPLAEVPRLPSLDERRASSPANTTKAPLNRTEENVSDTEEKADDE